MKTKKSIFWGVLFIAAAFLIIVANVLNGMNVIGDLPVMKIVLGLLLAAWIINALYKHHFVLVYFPASFLFMLFEPQIAQFFHADSTNLISNWVLLLCALLLSVGTAALSSGTKYQDNGEDVKRVARSDESVNGKWYHTRYIDSADFEQQYIEVNMSSSEVFFENAESYHGGGTLTVDNNMGSLVIHVPHTWHISSEIKNNLGHITTAYGDAQGPVLTLKGENNMGSISIQTI